MFRRLSARYRALRFRLREEFLAVTAPLLRHDLVQQLDLCMQHGRYTRLRHSLEVSYLSFLVTRLLHWHSAETARAALLHDLFFHEEGQHAASLLRSHPVLAVENARKVCTLTNREENIILRHMWLLTAVPPRYKEGFVVTFVDKYCAAREFVCSILGRKHRYSVFAMEAERHPVIAAASALGQAA